MSDANEVRFELNRADDIVVDADNLRNALKSLPDQPTTEVAMVNDEVIVAGDGHVSDAYVRVFRPSDTISLGNPSSGYVHSEIDEQTRTKFTEYVQTDVMDEGMYVVEETHLYSADAKVAENDDGSGFILPQDIVAAAEDETVGIEGASWLHLSDQR